MQSRRKLWMIVLVVVIILMIAGAGMLLIQGFAAFYQVEKRLTGKKAELEALYNRNPFPSEANLQTERRNLQTLDQQIGDLMTEMGRGQVQSIEQSPPKFIAQFWAVRKALQDKARERGVAVAETFDYGFGRHMSGSLPAPQDVARLTQQLTVVQQLCDALFDAGVLELNAVGREEFETGDKAAREAERDVRPRSRRPAAETASINTQEASAGVIPEGAMYGHWHFLFKFTAREGALLAALNRLAKEPLFVVVSSLEVKGDDSIKSINTDAAGREARGGAEAAEPAAAASRGLKIVCGRDVPLQVSMGVDVYQFKAGNASKPGLSGKSEK